MAEVSIRPATIEDVSALVELQLQLSAHHVQLDPANPRYEIDEPHWRALIEDALVTGGSRFLVAEQDGEIRGFVRVSFVDKPWGVSAEMDTLVVDEDVRGRGVGKELAEAAEDLARQAGARGVRANVLAPNKRGQDFYRRMGYQEIAVRFGKPLV